VLKPKAVQTVTIHGHSAGDAVPVPALQPDAKAATPEPEAKPTTFAARMELVAAPLRSTTGARADLEPQEALQPETRRSERRVAPKREKHVARTPAKKRVARHAHEDKKPESQGDLISALKKLVTPETKPPARKSKKQSQS
jgi:hypothetical protein